MDWTYFWSLIFSSKSEVLGTWLAATGAVAAWLTIFFEVRRRQAERWIQMKTEYDNLFSDRSLFWPEIRKAYATFRNGQSSRPEHLEGLIRAAGPPPGLGEIELAQWPSKYTNRLQPDQRTMWEFAQKVYPPREGREGNVTDHSLMKTAGADSDGFHEARSKLAKFWNKWTQVLCIRRIAKEFLSAYDQWILLSWLEIALVQWTRDLGKGKLGLYNLTKRATRYI